jgi:hypothetical protein
MVLNLAQHRAAIGVMSIFFSDICAVAGANLSGVYDEIVASASVDNE